MKLRSEKRAGLEIEPPTHIKKTHLKILPPLTAPPPPAQAKQEHPCRKISSTPLRVHVKDRKFSELAGDTSMIPFLPDIKV